ncbi:GDP/UDP-N [Parelusimicrobium proximum]|uniref:UDP-N-acetylglucosamine 2-epimerase n=1 Tax=Parelusimicrobium proximum TaxID=3228953 RepID=UPI003D1748F0
MKIAVLTSSRADYGIYLPLLKKMQADKDIDLRIIAFGTHTSKRYGHTIDTIRKDGFKIDYAVDTTPAKDGALDISEAIGKTQEKFARIWNKQKDNYNYVLCLGDRYEMFASVSAAVPFNMTFAHLQGGETTLGAIDDVYRHAITLFSRIHFTALDNNSSRVAEITGSKKNIYNVGSLSLDNLKNVELYSKKEFSALYDIDASKPYILVTFHPETVNLGANKKSLKAVLDTIRQINMPTVITMPNSDTMGLYFRSEYEKFAKKNKNVKLVETFGTRGYFSAMKYAAFMLGNSSSGIIEAASLGLYVVNVGERQKGRAAGKNVFHCAASEAALLKTMRTILKKPRYTGGNIYYKGGAADKIIKILKRTKI